MDYFFPFYPSKAKKIKIKKKNEKETPGYHHSTYVYQKLWSNDVQFLRYGAQQMDGQMDGQTDGWKKWHKEVGAPSKNARRATRLKSTSNNKHDWTTQKYLNALHYNRSQKQTRRATRLKSTSNNKHDWTPKIIWMFCTTIEHKSRCTTFLLIYCKNMTNFLFWVLCSCLATSIKNNNANL